MDSRWQLIALLVLLGVMALLALLGVAWLIQISPLPGFLKTVLEACVLGFLVPTGMLGARKVRAGRHPFAKDRPERG